MGLLMRRRGHSTGLRWTVSGMSGWLSLCQSSNCPHIGLFNGISNPPNRLWLIGSDIKFLLRWKRAIKWLCGAVQSKQNLLNGESPRRLLTSALSDSAILLILFGNDMTFTVIGDRLTSGNDITFTPLETGCQMVVWGGAIKTKPAERGIAPPLADKHDIG